MAEYICYKCREKLSQEEGKKVRCPYCGCKIIVKKRPKFLKTVKAR